MSRADNAYARHRRQVEDLVKYYHHKIPDLQQAKYEALKREGRNVRTEADILRERHRFIWPDEEEEDAPSGSSLTEEDVLAKEAYDRLFKEYALVNLKHYRTGQIALRWRNEDEVVKGIGEFTCAGTRCEHHLGLPTTSSPRRPDLEPYEVNFGYIEQGKKRNELVKVMCCPTCAKKLSYKSKHDKSRDTSRSAAQVRAYDPPDVDS